MPGFGPVGSFPVGALPDTGGVTNLFNIPTKITYYASNAISTQAQNTAGLYRYFAYTGGQILAPTGPRHVSWFGTEILHGGNAFGHVSWIGLEILHVGSAVQHVSWIGTEVLHVGSAVMHISMICVEILRSVRAQDDEEVTHIF